MNGDLTHLGDKNVSLRPNDVANIKQTLEDNIIQAFILTFTDLITFKIELDLTTLILKLYECSGTHDSPAHDSACKTDVLK